MEIINMGEQISSADFEQFSVGVYNVNPELFLLILYTIILRHYNYSFLMYQLYLQVDILFYMMDYP